MTPTDLLPAIGGLVAGLLLAIVGITLYLRAGKRGAAALLADAQQKAQATRKQADQEAAQTNAAAAQTRASAEQVRALAEQVRASAEQTKAAAALEGKMEALRLREEGDRDLSRRREEADRADQRAEEREKALARRVEQTDQQDKALAARVVSIDQQEVSLKSRAGEIDLIIKEQHIVLERVAGLTSEEAKRELLQKVEDEARAQAAALARDIREQAKKEAEKDAKKIIALAVQRLAAEHTAETTVSAVPLPSDEMKGRIIGREGRNIRAFETATGVDLIIDDTPDTVVVSCFDPIRREVGRR